jgi:hypothetical protein
MKEIYSIQPYEVGSKKYKCHAVVIPSDVIRECDINSSSIFNLKVDEKTKQIILIGPLSAKLFENTISKNKELVSQASSIQDQSIPLRGGK